jgi:hypothetical protein
VTTGALERLVRRSSGRRDPAPERCDLCAVPLPDRHRHLLDEERGELLCGCQACVLLFERDAAGGRHYRLVPQRRLRLAGVPTDELGVPVGLAFFVRQPDGRVVAGYPSPAGATTWEVDQAAWRRLVERCPVLGDLQPGVEALLVDTARGADEHWLVPIDDCYRLVALVRRQWTGLSGGSAVWAEIERFFAELGPRAARPRPGRSR